MRRYIQHQDLKISHFVTTQWEHPVHNHNHFEIIFIHRGKGQHCLSGHHYDYSGQNLFLLAPSDTHHFDIKEETEFTFLKFTNVYLDISQLLTEAHRRSIPILTNSPDTTRSDQLIRLMVEEWNESMHQSNETILLLIQTLVSILKRNIQKPLTAIVAGIAASSDPNSKISVLLHYLHSNIHTPEYIHLDHLADKFGYSRHYMGIFFKEQTGMSLREYINQYKITLIEHRLQNSSHSIKEISNELGFTDQSHFNKFFRTHKGMSPSTYRESHIRQHTKTTHGAEH